MFDTMTVTKAGGALCGSLLVFLLGSWAASALYTTGGAKHGADELVQGYKIDTGADEPAEAAEEGPAFADLYAAADPAAGEKVFAKCRACHKLDGSNGTGPHLDGVVDRLKASVGGFNYSDALKGMSAEPWSPENLDKFLASPKGYAPGNKMSFAGLPKAEERANLIKYLSTVTGG
ncbi:c-type cytochrome [Falsigemmobacter intermedius]|uniref:Cytochrome c family protein n=1 Tax=Falsigemmobacter intermedius TaxID=1553448 RepID=A0A3S3Y942_9RHOB|nr:cytochrome c family protein [Falsigemmobacter intermedius]RWY39515.1 cytochrome c family protein [Falsigemmobacter intermedius]